MCVCVGFGWGGGAVPLSDYDPDLALLHRTRQTCIECIKYCVGEEEGGARHPQILSQNMVPQLPANFISVHFLHYFLNCIIESQGLESPL